MERRGSNTGWNFQKDKIVYWRSSELVGTKPQPYGGCTYRKISTAAAVRYPYY